MFRYVDKFQQHYIAPMRSSLIYILCSAHYQRCVPFIDFTALIRLRNAVFSAVENALKLWYKESVGRFFAARACTGKIGRAHV